ncbi:histidine-type phosphatase [Caldalkalibacillus mannanilyticus]|uniref:histidine-type phosphatase n=1 Tax=Caldalkalibacillus mannanilyticus TaxID=1418 RepID=UPI000468AE71|nr:histidine-type phosphatase [Caldalkalibacillus mannanilyticus]
MLNKRTKKSIVAILVMGLLTLTFVINAFAATTKRTLEVSGGPISLVLEGQKIHFANGENDNSMEPFLADGRVYVPIRALADALGKTVEWDEKTNTVYVRAKVSGDHQLLEEKNEFLSTKAPYPYQETTYTEPPAGYEPIFINHVGRHGSRHLSSAKYDKTLMELLTIAENEGDITDVGRELKNEVARLMEVERENYGQLTISGKQELKDMGIRAGHHYRGIFGEEKQIKAFATFKDRAPDSRDEFLNGLRESLAGMDLDIESSSYEENRDPYLRPFDISPNYKEYKDNGEWIGIYKEYLSREQSTIYAREVLLQLFSEAFYNRLAAGEFKLKDEKGKVNLKNPTDAAFNLYQLYIISSNLKGEGPFEFRKYFTDAQLQWYEGIDSIEDFYEKGPSLPSTDLPQNISAPLVKELIVSTEESLRKQDVAGIFRFAHAETIIPLSSFLDIQGANVSTAQAEQVSQIWKASVISPMAANIQWVLYSNGNDYLVKMLRNEQEIAFPIETEHYPYYRWEDVKAYYQEKVQRLGVDLKNTLEEDITLLNESF